MNVLIILGHPRRDSFSEALAYAYKEGALEAGANVSMFALADKAFNPNVTTVSPQHQSAEDDICQAQELIARADHLVFVYPTWWGTMPALLKGFLDRVFTPGFAFSESEDTNDWGKLLKGKSAQLITTMDTPGWVYRWIYKSPGHNALKRATLQFCGVNPVRTLAFSPMKNATETRLANYLTTARKTGLKLKDGILSTREKIFNKAISWLKALRLQFYPMTWIAYTIGAFGAAHVGYAFDPVVFWVGFALIFFIEVATVLSNDYFDYESDLRNRFYSPFSGGSRVLIEKELSFREYKAGIGVALTLSLLAAGGLLLMMTTPGSGALLVAVPCFLAIGYTAPPVKLSYRGLGELDVGITHSLAVILCGFVFQGGGIANPFPWLLSVPLFLGILPSIILAGIPDYEADKSVSKKTVAVRLGQKGAARLAMVLVVLAAVAGVCWQFFGILPGAYSNVIYMIVPHAAVVVYLLSDYIGNTTPPQRINLLMVASLTYVLWFGVVPLVNLF